eukprot:SAG11_NODE_1741_length_4336_cov_1.517583_6_plen_88_part_00
MPKNELERGVSAVYCVLGTFAVAWALSTLVRAACCTRPVLLAECPAWRPFQSSKPTLARQSGDSQDSDAQYSSARTILTPACRLIRS